MLLTVKGNYNTNSIEENVKVIETEPINKNINISIDLSKQFKVAKIIAEACLMLTGLADFKKYSGL